MKMERKFLTNFVEILWIKHQLEDFNLGYTKILILCDKINAINLAKNPIQHSKSKHIDIKHNFIRDHVHKGKIELSFVNTEDKIVDVFAKPLAEDRLCYIKNLLNMTSF